MIPGKINDPLTERIAVIKKLLRPMLQGDAYETLMALGELVGMTQVVLDDRSHRRLHGGREPTSLSRQYKMGMVQSLRSISKHVSALHISHLLQLMTPISSSYRCRVSLFGRRQTMRAIDF